MEPEQAGTPGAERARGLPVEDYALIGDAHTAALVGRNGSVDWLCLPRFDSGACFAALLGGKEHGFWRISPAGGAQRVTRRYRGETLGLETEFRTSEGVARLVDCMPRRSGHASVVRVVEGVSGRVAMRMDLVIRFDYGWVVPWMSRAGDHLHGIAGPDSICLATPAQTRGENLRTVAEFSVGPGDRVPFVLSWHPQLAGASCGGDAMHVIAATEAWWREWSGRCRHQGPWRDAVVRSLVTLKALSYEPTGGIVAAVTTSLPEDLGGARNWDYRYCWLRVHGTAAGEHENGPGPGHRRQQGGLPRGTARFAQPPRLSAWEENAMADAAHQEPLPYNYAHFDHYIAAGGEQEDTAAFRGSVHAGQRAEDFTLLRLDDAAQVGLASLWRPRPLVMEFGSFT